MTAGFRQRPLTVCIVPPNRRITPSNLPEIAAVHMSLAGPTRTIRDVRIPVAIRCKAHLEQTAFNKPDL